MTVVVIVLAVIAVLAIVLALVTRSRLAAQRAATAEATTLAEQTATERDAERARADAAESARDDGASRLADVETRAADAEARVTDAETRAADAEQRAASAGLDPELLWSFEQARSERTWRQSVAVGSEGASVFDGSDHVLREALQVELDAAREDVGALVELECDVPSTITAAGAVLVLRAAQELLAHAVKAAEESTLRVQAEGADVVVEVVATDEHGEPVSVEPLALPESADIEMAAGSVRVRRVIPA